MTRQSRSIITKLLPRSPGESHRAATPLELFFDLVFVVAIAQASSIFHHHIADAHIWASIGVFLVQFFAIWWAWMNFTWFASAYDNDDGLYRILVFVQMTGALMLAAGIPGFVIEDHVLQTTEYAFLAVYGYVAMRLAMIIQWLRVAYADPPRRKTAIRYAVGIISCQVGWVLLLYAPPSVFVWGFIVLVIAELLVPAWAERAGATTWHRDHILERYGLFTIIVLGESVLALSLGIRSALDTGEIHIGLICTILGGLLILFSMWWLYFDKTMEHMLTSLRKTFFWGYGHYLIFASAAAVGAALAMAVEAQSHHVALSDRGVALAIAIPVSVYLFVLWLLHYEKLKENKLHLFLPVIVIVCILLSPLVGVYGVLVTGGLLVGMVVVKGLKVYHA